MCDIPENLQIIKREPSPSTPEDKSSNNIKAKLNLHVKRRLQDFNQINEENVAANSKIQGVNINQDQEKRETKQKRPYHKRTNKSKSATKLIDAASTAVTVTKQQRKNKHKIKHIIPENQETFVAKLVDETVVYNSTGTTGALSAGDEDEVGHENELKAGREKEKCPDVLAMVLSMKKRSLMQNPEVQSFIKDVMKVIKS